MIVCILKFKERKKKLEKYSTISFYCAIIFYTKIVIFYRKNN